MAVSKNADSSVKAKKQKKTAPFDEYRSRLSSNDAAKLDEFMADLNQHLLLSRKEREQITCDFERALIHYADNGISFDEAVTRLSPRNLGGFYARPPIRWYPLDDAAKVYPLSMKHDQMAIFRLSAYMKSPIIPELMQMALTFIMKRFPSFATTVKKGVFWHYLDASKRRYEVLPETEIPCRPLKIAVSGSQSFRVLYFKNRVSVEYFHVLTDGTGGMEFLKALLCEYLRLSGVAVPESPYVFDVDATPVNEETENAFLHAEKAPKSSGFVDKPAVQLSGKLARHKPCRIVHYKFDAALLNETAKKKGGTITAYILSQMFIAGKYSTDESAGDMNIQVPINMRKFYRSATVRNFSLYCGVRFPLDEITSSKELIPKITAQLHDKTSDASMREMVTSAERMVNSTMVVPLFIKAPFVRIGYGFLGDKIFTNTLSNLGIVSLPDEMKPYIESMDFVLGTVISNRASCALVTVNNVATFSVSKLTRDPSFEEKLYDLFVADGLAPVVEGSAVYED